MFSQESDFSDGSIKYVSILNIYDWCIDGTLTGTTHLCQIVSGKGYSPVPNYSELKPLSDQLS